MKNCLILAWILFSHPFISLKAQDDVTFFNYWEYHSDIKNSLYKHFSSIALDQLESRKAVINKLKTKADWLQRQSIVNKKLLEIVGSFPEKTPLNAKVTGVLDKEDYRIEKVLYESRPGYYVTGALYIPDGVMKNAPAIFYACGHSLEGFRVGIYQHIIINLVKKGFVVFTIDPMGQGERYEYWDKKRGQPRFSIPDHEHSFAGAQCLISGYSTSSNFIWDIMRGIDYMITRREIDKNRIGMTGRSGGGNMTAYLGALDQRILATAPECYITSYEYLYKSIGPQCAEQNLRTMIQKGLDHGDFIEARAPKPTMIISTTRDFFSIQGTRESFAEAKIVYEVLGARDKLTMVEDDYIHKSTLKNREAMYAFFQKYLDNPGSPRDLNVQVPAPEELQVTQSGQLATTFNSQSVFSLNKAVVQKQVDFLDQSRIDYEEHLEKIPSVAAHYSGFQYPDKFGKPIFSGRYTKPDYTLEKYLIPGSGDYVLPAVLLQPLHTSPKKIVLIANSQGLENTFNQDSLAHVLVKAGHAVIIFDLPGIGSMGPGYLKGDSYIGNTSYNQWFAATLVGMSNVGLRAEDIIRIVHFAKNKTYSSISLLSLGPLGSDLLHAAVFEPSIKNICLIKPFLSYANIASTRLYKPEYVPFTVPGAIEEYDLPDLLAWLCPRNVLIINPFSGDGLVADSTITNKNLHFPLKIYSKKNAPGNFDIIHETDGQMMVERLLSWLR